MHPMAEAMNITGLAVRDGQLCLNDLPMETVPLPEALQGFIDFVRGCGGVEQKAILMGYSISLYEIPILHRDLQKQGKLSELAEIIRGYVDVFDLVKALIPYRQIKNYKQKTLVKRYLPRMQYRAHNALDDARSLEALHRVKLAGRYRVSTYLRTL